MTYLKWFFTGATSAGVLVAGYVLASDFTKKRLDRVAAASLYTTSLEIAAELRAIPETKRATNFRSIVDKANLVGASHSEFDLIEDTGVFVARNNTAILLIELTQLGINCSGAPKELTSPFCLKPNGATGE